LAEAPEEKDFATHLSGYPFLDPNLKWRIPELDVFAGPYGSGKSLLAQLLAFRFTATIGSASLLCSWEDEPAELRRNLALHALAHGDDPADLLSRVHYVRRNPDDDRLIAWYADLVRYHNARYGTRFFVLDPWNEIDHVKDSRQSETDYVRDMMKEFRRLVNKLGIILIVVTHVPAKMIRGNGEIEPFRLAQAFGSVNFANKVDRGICVLRTKSLGGEHMILRFDKSKIERKMGRKGTTALVFDDEAHTLR
jgi:AAA domain